MGAYRCNQGILGFIALMGAAVALAPRVAWGQNTPLSHVAEPGVYKVLEENDQFRVVLATWKPGQRDVLHSHLASATYAVTDCNVRLYGPNNAIAFEGPRHKGSVVLQAAIPSHSFENAGTSNCQILIVERK